MPADRPSSVLRVERWLASPWRAVAIDQPDRRDLAAYVAWRVTRSEALGQMDAWLLRASLALAQDILAKE